MSLRESELSRSHRAQRAHAKQQKRKHRKQNKNRSALDRPLSLLLDSQVLTFFEWCQLNRFSVRTGRRILRSGHGPPIVQLSSKRIGVTVGSNRMWQQSRERT
jgi:hypothetical protein